jgi:menaquinol-cytochrome c reductase iron-sulfur subunit
MNATTPGSPSPNPDQPAPTRRTFYLEVIYGLWALISATLAGLAAAYLFVLPKARKEGEWVDAADVTKLPLKTPQEVVFTHNRADGWKITSEKATAWVVKLSDDQAVAFAPQCTHLGCAYHWDESNHNFLCPCHTSTFSIDGKVLSGPAPRPLDRYAVKIAGTKLQIGPMEPHA